MEIRAREHCPGILRHHIRLLPPCSRSGADPQHLPDIPKPQPMQPHVNIPLLALLTRDIVHTQTAALRGGEGRGFRDTVRPAAFVLFPREVARRVGFCEAVGAAERACVGGVGGCCCCCLCVGGCGVGGAGAGWVCCEEAEGLVDEFGGVDAGGGGWGVGALEEAVGERRFSILRGLLRGHFGSVGVDVMELQPLELEVEED